MTVQDAFRLAVDALADAGVPTAEVDAWWLLEAASGSTRGALIAARGSTLVPEAQARFREMLARRVAREPLQHIVGEIAFYGLPLRVDPRALIPRPETERLVELTLLALHGVERPRVLDVGTGSGAIALSVRAERPDATVMGSDVSADALALARDNAARLDFDVTFVESDLFAAEEVRAFARDADAIVSNPPYLPDRDRAEASPEVARDPAGALYGGPDGLDLAARLIDEAFALLAPGGLLLMELDPRNVRAAAQLGSAWRDVDVASDLTGRERFLVLRR